MNPHILPFLKSQKLMALACADGDDLWIANVYVGVDDDGSIYFVSPEDTTHSQMILKNPRVAFSFAWFDPGDHRNRKAIQGKGTCRIASKEETNAGVHLHNQNFPEFKERITVEWIATNEFTSRVWILEPEYVKYWDDELFGEDETVEWGEA